MPTNKQPFTFHLDEEVLQKIKVIAKEETRSASNLLEYLCKKCIREFEQENGEIDLEQDA
ncbi:MAG: Arc family DNA-binding protein [Clostridiales bacterium]|nr:Arc family DNA-binding protein [Clostridiales bacterium]